VDFTEYKFGKNTAYDKLNQLLNSEKIEGLTLKQKLTEFIQSESYKNNLTDPVKLAQGIDTEGTKYQRINYIYQLYKTRAEAKFELEKANYVNVDNPKRNLFDDVRKNKRNKRVIEGGGDVNQLQSIINFQQQ
jgi:hypothetical protein